MFEIKENDFKIESVEPFCVSFVPSKEHLNVNGKVHGGVMYLLCDDVIGKYVTKNERIGAASDGSIRYYRPAEAGEKMLATLNVRKEGKRLGVYMVELKKEDGTLIADSMFTVSFLS